MDDNNRGRLLWIDVEKPKFYEYYNIGPCTYIVGCLKVTLMNFPSLCVHVLILHGKELSKLLLLGDIIAIRYEMAGSIVHVDVQMFLSLLCI